MIAEMIREKPIIFPGSAIKAILSGRKTTMRHVVSKSRAKSPFGTKGDRLWVREEFRVHSLDDNVTPRNIPKERRVVHYESYGKPLHRNLLVDYPFGKVCTPDREIFANNTWASCFFGKLRHAVHMPRWASRLTLEITSVRKERLQEISNMDAIRESVLPEDQWPTNNPFNSEILTEVYGEAARRCFEATHELWESNPMVWVTGFKHIP